MANTVSLPSGNGCGAFKWICPRTVDSPTVFSEVGLTLVKTVALVVSPRLGFSPLNHKWKQLLCGLHGYHFHLLQFIRSSNIPGRKKWWRKCRENSAKVAFFFQGGRKKILKESSDKFHLSFRCNKANHIKKIVRSGPWKHTGSSKKQMIKDIVLWTIIYMCQKDHI